MRRDGRIYSVAMGHEDEHAAKLKKGLSCLPEGFVAAICSLCDGRGSYKQIYNLGCGQGYSSSTGGCDYCDCSGLMQVGKPAPDSVLNQVLMAAK